MWNTFLVSSLMQSSEVPLLCAKAIGYLLELNELSWFVYWRNLTICPPIDTSGFSLRCFLFSTAISKIRPPSLQNQSNHCPPSKRKINVGRMTTSSMQDTKFLSQSGAIQILKMLICVPRHNAQQYFWAAWWGNKSICGEKTPLFFGVLSFIRSSWVEMLAKGEYKLLQRLTYSMAV